MAFELTFLANPLLVIRSPMERVGVRHGLACGEAARGHLRTLDPGIVDATTPVRAAVVSLGGLWSRGARRCLKPQSGGPAFGELSHTSIRCRSGR